MAEMTKIDQVFFYDLHGECSDRPLKTPIEVDLSQCKRFARQYCSFSRVWQNIYELPRPIFIEGWDLKYVLQDEFEGDGEIVRMFVASTNDVIKMVQELSDQEKAHRGRKGA